MNEKLNCWTKIKYPNDLPMGMNSFLYDWHHRVSPNFSFEMNYFYTFANITLLLVLLSNLKSFCFPTF